MLSQAKVLYQVKLILDYLPEEEYKLIPQEMIDYIEDSTMKDLIPDDGELPDDAYSSIILHKLSSFINL